ncbi:hypothetical protein [Butyrivibrio sp. VCB2001]|uniref:hypothetical protein n=1 Tax=Butyrivibrio sp. VCB2001 TaxID=1280667 RepID=UPI0003F81318|nr:hypothetical protein [Butyrivibrio sp. VCB2001]
MDLFANTSKGKYDLSDDYKDGLLKPSLWCALCAFVTMLICSRSSFLYVFNLWDDANSYFTVGKCIFRGFVPYRDLFDQKGIMLYFIYGLGSLISATTFRGVFVMEIIAAFFSLLAILRIYQLFLEPRTFPYILTPITGAVIYSSANFYWGGSAEEFLFPFIMWGMYQSLRYFREVYPKVMPYKVVLVGGILAGCVLNIKFNSLGLFFAWMAMVFFADLLGEKAIAKAVISCFVFLGGMGIATLPWVIYFGIHGAIDDWVYVYIYKNVFEYSKKLTFGERIATFYDIIKNHVLNNFPVYLLITIGILYFLASTISSFIPDDRNSLKRRDRFFIHVEIFELINMGMLFAFLMIVIFIGGVSLPYYSFPINGFVVFGFIPFCYIIERFLKGRIEKNTHGRNYDGAILDSGLAFAFSLVSFAAAVVVVIFTSMNVKVMKLKAEDLWLYHFKDYIEASGVEDPGIILEYTFDVGLYTVLDVEPICYYFQTQTLNMQEVFDYQKQYVHNGEADFVVSVNGEAEGLGDRYDFVMKERCQFYDFDHTYYLYQRNDNPVTGE